MEFAGISQTAIDSLVFSPAWKILPLPVASEEEKGPLIIIVPPSQAVLRQEIADRLPLADVRLLTPQSIDDLTRAVAGSAALRLCFVTRTLWRVAVSDEDVSAFFHLLKALGDKPAVKLDVFTDKAVASPLFESVTHPVDGVYVGLAQTLAKERPEWTVRIFSLQKLTADALQDLLRISLPTRPGTPLCIAEGRYGVAEMQPTTLSPWPVQSAFRQQGTYLILGGAGGLGGKLAEYLAARYQAKLVILGRRPEAHDLLMRLRGLGAAEAHYHSVDLSDRAALQAVLDQYAVIHGVVHSALVLEDASLAAMSEQTLFNVLRPKVHGAYNLARVLKGRTLDFCLFFSSIQSYIANPGQGNYTAACVAKDAFSDLLHNGLMINSKVINWGFWGSVGVVASEHYRERMKKLQIGSIDVDEGLAVIERFLVTERRQITVVKASDLALKRLNIAPHSVLQEAMVKNVTIQTSPQLRDQAPAVSETGDDLIPVYRTQDPLVARNEAMSAALQEYARWRLSQTPMPEAIVPKFGKLAAALRSIRAGHSPERAEVIRRYPELQGHIHLLDQCIENLPAILRGETNPLSVIFPDGGFELVEPVYRDNPIADYFNQVVARCVANLQKARSGRFLRIIEIGAGTGSTTQFVLPELAPGNVSYTFTDLSFAFLNKARRRFADYPFVEYKICNIEKPPAFEELFDVVIATNVIHATSDLPESLRQVRRLLRDDGVFVLNEITSCQDYATLTFGLTDGWWLSQDSYRIPNSPLLSGDSWRRLILQAGFQGVDAHGGEEQQVIVGFAGADIQQRHAPQNSAQEVEVSRIESSHDSAAAQTASQDGGASQASIEGFLQAVIADVLQFDPSEIERDMPFSEMGIDSLISMELLKPVKEKTGYLPATILFEYPTIRQLAEHILTSGLTWREGEARAEPVAVPVVKKTPPSWDSLAEIMNQVRAVIADTMMMEPEDVEADTPFQEYGVDSIISLELIRPLKEIFGYLPATVLFEYPSLRQLAEYLATSFSGETTPDISSAQASETSQHADNSVVDERARDTQSSSGAPEKSLWRPGDMAIIGMSARLPKAQDVERFWDNLRQGRDCTDVIPAERWKQEVFLTDAPLNGRGSYTNRGAFIDDVDAFDHVFFNLTPNEAARIDPQERIMLEQTYRSMLDAGYTRKQWAGSDTAVFVGVMNGDYAWHTPVKTSTAPVTSLFWSMANRASYFFDWRGPSMAVDTACSASLTALHLACQALKNGDCEQAVVGGVNLITHPRHYEQLCGLHMLSRSEQCKPFGANADGFVDGEGVICLVMKRAEDAIRDNDRVYAFIKGSAINAGGRSNGYTAPNPEAQAALIGKALQAAGVSAQEVGYVEAHGTGTELGDPIELRALSKSYGAAAPQSIRLGSVKSNVGHLESAAGLCGVLKAVLQMRYGEWVPSLHAEQLNPHLDFTQTPFMLNRARCEWDAAAPRVSAVSSFGAGGGNAHVVIQGVAQALASSGTITDTAQGATRHEIYVIPLSHHSSAGLQQTLDGLRDWLQKGPVDMDALAYTLACARDHERFRRALVCRDQTDLIQQLGRDLQMTGVESQKGASGQAQQASPQRLTRDNAESVAAIYEAGNDLPWRDYYPQRQLAAVPEYVFIRHRHWIDSVESNFTGFHSLTQAHRINGRTMAPAAWTLSILCERADDGGFANIMWKDLITDPHNVEVIEEGDRTLFVGRGGFTEHCSAERIRDESVPQHISTVLARLDRENPLQAIDIDNAPRCSQAEIYGDFKQRGYDYGAPLQGIRWAQIRPGLIRAFLYVDHDWGRLVSPALLDAGLQLAILAPAGAAEKNGDAETAVFMPYYLERLVVNRLPDNEAVYGYCLEKTTAQASKARRFDFYFTDRQGEVLIMLEDMVSVVVRPHAEDEVDTRPRQVRPEPRFEVFDLS